MNGSLQAMALGFRELSRISANLKVLGPGTMLTSQKPISGMTYWTGPFAVFRSMPPIET